MKYLIISKYSKESNYSFISCVAQNKEEAISIIEKNRRYGLFSEMRSLSSVFKDCANTEEKIRRILELSNLSCDDFYLKGKQVEIEIEGDWKHDHQYCNSLFLNIFNAKKIGEEVTWEDGSDYYASLHKYKL